MDKDSSFGKYYIRACVGRGGDVINELVKRGAVNTHAYGGEGDGTMIYYINNKNEIALTNENEEIGYILLNSGWTELKLRKPRKTRKFMVTVTEGRTRCSTCPLLKTCDDEQVTKCSLSKEISDLFEIDRSLDGRTIEIEEII